MPENRYKTLIQIQNTNTDTDTDTNTEQKHTYKTQIQIQNTATDTDTNCRTLYEHTLQRHNFISTNVDPCGKFWTMIFFYWTMMDETVFDLIQ